MTLRVIAALSAVVVMVTPECLAWNKPGHMVSAAIAYEDLRSRNPEALRETLRVLKRHPQYESMWALRLRQVPQDRQDLCLLMLASRWADDVRGDEEYDHPDRHFVNIPYRPGEPPGRVPEGVSILTAFQESRSVAVSEDPEEERAVALCWLLHLVGDVHQPLHVITLITGRFPAPAGDKGGNRFHVRMQPGRMAISLHRFWDDLILGSERLQSVINRSVELRNRPDLTREKLEESLRVKDFGEWALESYSLAARHAYLDGTLQGSPRQDDPPPLPEGYRDAAKKIGETRIVVAGLRMSDLLADMFGRQEPGPGRTPD